MIEYAVFNENIKTDGPKFPVEFIAGEKYIVVEDKNNCLVLATLNGNVMCSYEFLNDVGARVYATINELKWGNK